MYKYPVKQKASSLKTVRGLGWTKLQNFTKMDKFQQPEILWKTEENQNPYNMHTFDICSNNL